MRTTERHNISVADWLQRPATSDRHCGGDATKETDQPAAEEVDPSLLAPPCRSSPSTATFARSAGASYRWRSASAGRRAFARAVRARMGRWSITSATGAGGMRKPVGGVTAGQADPDRAGGRYPRPCPSDPRDSGCCASGSRRREQRRRQPRGVLPAMPHDPRPAGASEAALAHAVPAQGARRSVRRALRLNASHAVQQPFYRLTPRHHG